MRQCKQSLAPTFSCCFRNLKSQKTIEEIKIHWWNVTVAVNGMEQKSDFCPNYVQEYLLRC
jgi:hypothetical protein